MFAAIKRTFQALDDEIIKEALSSDIKDCQFGGSTAVIALRIGHVSLLPPNTPRLPAPLLGFVEKSCESLERLRATVRPGKSLGGPPA